jgi:glutamate formiminotransferase
VSGLPVIESVPNVSEGRRADIIAALATAIAGTRGARLLDVSSDASHHRSVFTLAGESAAVERAILALFERAVADIDLRTHRGEHPRVGAVDVVPFVPLPGATMAACIALARQVGAAVADHFGVPVFLYEEAAVDPARRRLETIRRGGLGGLSARMAQPGWAPDFGPPRPHPTAGVSIIGARLPLIAFNVQLTTSDVELAKRIAGVVRESGGGLPCVKAIGLSLHERSVAQVSMNLTDYRRTSLAEAFAAVKRHAAGAGVAILDSEIIGLVPAAAMNGIDPADLQLRNFTTNQILENRLAANP